MKKMRWLALAVLAAAVCATPAQAAGYSGYVCQSTYFTAVSGITGTDGHIALLLYAGPDCTGGMVHGVLLCSPGATSPSCATAGFLYRESRLLALQQSFVQAIDHNIRTLISTDQACGDPTWCGALVTFFAN